MRFRIEKVNDLYRKRGIGIWYRRGCTGTTYREPGRNQFLSIHTLFLLWEITFYFSWKSHLHETNT